MTPHPHPQVHERYEYEDTDSLDVSLEKLGFAVTSERPVLQRLQDSGEYILLIHLGRALSLQCLSRLAACDDRALLIDGSLGPNK
jgi:hypothetical protein